MKIVLTGSLGNISKPLAIRLVQLGHTVTVISSKQERQPEIESLGAKAAIGTMQDINFLTQTFKGADLVYLMEALGHSVFFDHTINMVEANIEIARNYKQAIEQSGVKKVIHLSSIGSHLASGNGILAFHYQAENILQQLPQDVSIKFMRPVGFYNNLFAFIPGIKATNSIFQNYGGDQKEPWVSPLDIAEVIAEEVEQPFKGRTFRYIVSEELSPNEVAAILGGAIGQPDLQWVTISSEQFVNNAVGIGMNPQTARGLAEMNEARVNGTLYEHYLQHKPIPGKTKLKDFAQSFAAIYQSNNNN
jgi:uncharacterized protein YbjT (DUF2867 family)